MPKENPNFKILFTLLALFLATQLIGIYVVNNYTPVKVVGGEVVEVPAPSLPFGMGGSPQADIQCEVNSLTDFFSCTQYIYGIVFAFAVAILIFFFLTKLRLGIIMRIWFFIVVVIALGISFEAFIPSFSNSSTLILLLVIPLAYFKIYKRNFIVHNFTELLIYPGIAAVFVPLLNIYTIVLFLVLISAYDVWAVWHSGVMQKMAKFQIEKLRIFAGFSVPYASKRVKERIKKMKKTLSKEELKKKRIKVNLGILGGGDVIFPIFTAGVMLKTFGLVPALFVTLGATAGLMSLFFIADRKKWYPAMPFITVGIFAGMLLSWVASLFPL